MSESTTPSPGAWTSRPIFVSSTFKDMHAERDYLRQRVFPRLEEALRARRHLLEPIDLRLGVETGSAETEDERELLVLKVCLDEIKRSRPYLVVLLGDRYGWTPPEERMAAAAREHGFATDLTGTSVTALEIEFGLLRVDPEQRQRSLFFFRRPLPYDAMPRDIAAAFSDAHSDDPGTRAQHGRLEALKARLRQDPELGPRIFDYTACWDAAALKVTGLDELGELVFHHLWVALDEETRSFVALLPPTWQDEERESLAELVEHRCRDFTGRGELLRGLENLARSPAEEGAPWGVCLTGPPGSGKSAVLAELFRRLRADQSLLVLLNAAGGTPRGAEMDAMLRRWIGELGATIDTAARLPDTATPDDVETAFYSLLHRAASRQRVVVLADALDQSEPTPRGQHVTWLRRAGWPTNARFIGTAVPGTASRAMWERAAIGDYELSPLTQEDVEEIGHRVWKRYHRTIDPEVLHVLALKQLPDGTPAAGNSLWLTLALEQLNLLDADDFARAERELTGSPTERMRALVLDTAERMPPDVEGLYGWLLAQTGKVFGLPHAGSFAVSIALSRLGWRESDLMNLVPRFGHLLFPDEDVAGLDALGLAAMRRAFRAHVVRRGRLGQLDFFHVQMRRAVEAWAGLTRDEARTLHGAIADHLETLPDTDPLRESELMRHLIETRDARRAAVTYAGPITPTGERSGATEALVRFISTGLGDESTARTTWVCSMLDAPELTGEEVAALGRRFNFELDPALESLACVPARSSLLRATVRALGRQAPDAGESSGSRDLSASQERLGDLLMVQGNLAEAMRLYRESLAIRRRLAAEEPSATGRQRDLAVGLIKVGDVQVAQGDSEEALQSYASALGRFEQLVAAEPEDPGWQRNLSVCLGRMCSLQTNQGDLEGALRTSRASLALAERLAATEGRDPGKQRDLSVSQERVGNVQMAEGDLEEALRSFRASLAIAERLAAAEPDNVEWQRNLSVSHVNVAKVLHAQGDLAEAWRACGQALAILDRLAAADPANAAWQHDLSIAYSWLGVISEQAGSSDAGKWWRRALETLAGMKERGLHVSPHDEQILAALREKVGG